MKKIVFALLALLMLAVACLGVAEDVVLATAYNGELTVTRDQVIDEFDQMLEIMDEISANADKMIERNS